MVIFSSTFAKLCFSSVIIYQGIFLECPRAYMIFARARSGLCVRAYSQRIHCTCLIAYARCLVSVAQRFSTKSA